MESPPIAGSLLLNREKPRVSLRRGFFLRSRSSPSSVVQVGNAVGLGTIKGLCDGPVPPSSHRFHSQEPRSPDDALVSGASSSHPQNKFRA
jgi:hypothetical protein